jgi:SpoVK/Ycf46/Vps4 family AAA+-type ATPase
MQDRTAPVFVVATANDVSILPPELMRKGRFDEVFYVGLPTRLERAAVVAVAARAHGIDPATLDCEAIASATQGYSGAEITAAVPDAMFSAFADGGRPVETADILDAARQTTPLSKLSAEKIAGLDARQLDT